MSHLEELLPHILPFLGLNLFDLRHALLVLLEVDELLVIHHLGEGALIIKGVSLGVCLLVRLGHLLAEFLHILHLLVEDGLLLLYGVIAELPDDGKALLQVVALRFLHSFLILSVRPDNTLCPLSRQFKQVTVVGFLCRLQFLLQYLSRSLPGILYLLHCQVEHMDLGVSVILPIFLLQLQLGCEVLHFRVVGFILELPFRQQAVGQLFLHQQLTVPICSLQFFQVQIIRVGLRARSALTATGIPSCW